MSHRLLTLDELAKELGRDRRELEKLANRGRIPGRKIQGVWYFHSAEIQHWVEQQLPKLDERQLEVLERSQQSGEIDPEKPVSNLLLPETVQVPLLARTKRSVLESLIEVAGRSWRVWKPSDLLQAVLAREAIMSTGLDNGVAIPHPRNPIPHSLEESVIAFGRTLSGIPFGAPHHVRTDLFFMVLCKDTRTHLQVLARLSRMMLLPGFVESLREAEDSETAYRLICEADHQVASRLNKGQKH